MSFSRTCNLLSQYLKEKGSFGDLSLAMTCNLQSKGKQELIPPKTMNLLPRMETMEEASEGKGIVSDRTGLPPPVTLDNSPISDNLSATPRTEMEPKTAQLTIFYGGRVMVFNDFPADRAKEIMLLGERGVLPNLAPASAPINDGLNNSFTKNPDFASALGERSTESHLQRPPLAHASDLPIARKASLHRFLEKRKDRIVAKAPYQIGNGSTAPSSGREKSISWLAL